METDRNDSLKELINACRQALTGTSFIRLTLGAYHGKEEGLQNIRLTPVETKGGRGVSAVSRYERRDVTTMLEPTEAIDFVAHHLGPWSFRSAHLFTADADWQLRISKRGKAFLKRTAATQKPPTDLSHNRQKERPLDPTSAWLHHLGITDDRGEVVPSASRKWKQINRFVEIVGDQLERSPLLSADPLHVVDFGSGKGYLTFALHDYLSHHIPTEVRTTGVEIRDDLVRLSNDVARESGMSHLRFIEGDIGGAEVGEFRMMIALHACDTATDLALHRGITAGADLIVAAPCCHKEVRRLMTPPEVLQPMLRYGKHLEREAEMLTDTIRALLLEIHGYRVTIAEFVPIEHTPKNSLILAVRESEPNEEKIAEAKRRLEGLKGFYGIEGQSLEKQLRYNG